MKLFKGVAERRFPFIGWGTTYLHWISVIDLAHAFRLALESELPSGEVFIIAGKDPVSLKDLLQQIADAFGVRPPILRIPALPVQIVGSLCELICRPFGIEPPIYRRRVDFFTKTRCLLLRRLTECSGFSPEGIWPTR